jgi:hypothetical protein
VILVRLLQHAEVRTEVDVIGGSADDEGGHGFDSGSLGFGDAGLCCAEVDDLDIEAAGIKSGSNVLLGGDADGATGMIECGIGFHGSWLDSSGWFALACGVVPDALHEAVRESGYAKEGRIS